VAAAQRIYAKALFEAAQDAGRVDAVDRDFGAFAEALDGSPELTAFLGNPQVETVAKIDVLGQLAEGGDDFVRNVLRLLAEKGRGGEIAQVYVEFRAFVDRAQGRVAVELTTAHELSDDEARSIVSKIEQSSGRAVEATRNVDPSLIGGMILQAGSLRVDASVRGRLERLRRELATTR
jgi:F-type H+-transporting ATPase subunit delta